MTKLKVKGLKLKRLKVKGLVLHFCLKKISFSPYFFVLFPFPLFFSENPLCFTIFAELIPCLPAFAELTAAQSPLPLATDPLDAVQTHKICTIAYPLKLCAQSRQTAKWHRDRRRQDFFLGS